jgi:hypothetical protein
MIKRNKNKSLTAGMLLCYLLGGQAKKKGKNKKRNNPLLANVF